MIDRFLQQAPVPLAAPVSGFELDAGVVLKRVDSLTGVAATLQLAREPVEQPEPPRMHQRRRRAIRTLPTTSATLVT